MTAALVSPYLRQPLRSRQVFALGSFWRGCANARDAGDPLKTIYERIAEQLDAGKDPEAIPEIAEWLGRRASIAPRSAP